VYFLVSRRVYVVLFPRFVVAVGLTGSVQVLLHSRIHVLNGKSQVECPVLAYTTLRSFNVAAGESGWGHWTAMWTDVASLTADSGGHLVADTVDLVVGRRASSSRMCACYWNPSCCRACFAERDRLEEMLVWTSALDRTDIRVCRTLYEVEDSEARCRDVQVGSFRLVGVSQLPDSYGAGFRQLLPPMGTLDLPASLIWWSTLCPKERCRTRHASDG
jgi:hypothetical protein